MTSLWEDRPLDEDALRRWVDDYIVSPIPPSEVFMSPSTYERLMAEYAGPPLGPNPHVMAYTEAWGGIPVHVSPALEPPAPTNEEPPPMLTSPPPPETGPECWDEALRLTNALAAELAGEPAQAWRDEVDVADLYAQLAQASAQASAARADKNGLHLPGYGRSPAEVNAQKVINAATLLVLALKAVQLWRKRAKA